MNKEDLACLSQLWNRLMVQQKLFFKFRWYFKLFLIFFSPKSTISAECLNVRGWSNVGGTHEIWEGPKFSVNLLFGVKGFVSEKAWEESQQINQDFWGLIKVYKETKSDVCMCEACEGVCLVARTLLTLSWTLLCLKNTPFLSSSSLSLSQCSNCLVPS